MFVYVSQNNLSAIKSCVHQSRLWHHTEVGEHSILLPIQAICMDDVQKDMDTALRDETSVTSDNARVSEDVPRLLSPKSLPQSHTFTGNTSTMGRCSC